LSEMDQSAAPEVRQREGRDPIPAIGCAEHCEERLVLDDWNQSAVAKSPAAGREIAREYLDFANVWFSHGMVLRAVGAKSSTGR
jgi:hypothetical protein